MALTTPNFTAAQLYGLPGNIYLTDTSTGTDVLIAARRIYLIKADGTYLVPDGATLDYILWPSADTTITLVDILTKDYALNITVNWVNAGGGTLYTKNILYMFSQYSETFLYNQTEIQTANPLLVNDNKFYAYKEGIRVDLDSAQQAITLGGDIYAAQQCLDRATNVVNNKQFLFQCLQ